MDAHDYKVILTDEMCYFIASQFFIEDKVPFVEDYKRFFRHFRVNYIPEIIVNPLFMWDEMSGVKEFITNPSVQALLDANINFLRMNSEQAKRIKSIRFDLLCSNSITFEMMSDICAFFKDFVNQLSIANNNNSWESDFIMVKIYFILFFIFL